MSGTWLLNEFDLRHASLLFFLLLFPFIGVLLFFLKLYSTYQSLLNEIYSSSRLFIYRHRGYAVWRKLLMNLFCALPLYFFFFLLSSVSSILILFFSWRRRFVILFFSDLGIWGLPSLHASIVSMECYITRTFINTEFLLCSISLTLFFHLSVSSRL